MCGDSCDDIGLLEHPTLRDHNVQCGPGHKNGRSCMCCSPYVRRCAHSTTFDVNAQVCHQGGGGSTEEIRHYKTLD